MDWPWLSKSSREILNSCPYGPHIPPVFRDDVDQPGKLGHFFMAIDPNCFCGRDSFLDQIEKIIQELHEVPPACGFEDVLVPGEPESRTYIKRIQEGIPVGESLLAKIRALACD